MPAQLTIRNARLHNLKNITLSLPKEKLVVFTGISGSGKSTMAFDILYKESQRVFLESLGMVAFKLSKPPIDGITGLSAAISIDQHLANHSPRSTLGTSTDVYTYLRVLFARLGQRVCPVCGGEVPPAFTSGAEEWEADAELDSSSDDPVSFSTCPHCGAAVPVLSMAHFSFNKPAGACSTCTGLGTVQQVNVERLVDPQRSILDNAVTGWNNLYIQYNHPDPPGGRPLLWLYLRSGLAGQPVHPGPARPARLRGGGPHFTRHFPGCCRSGEREPGALRGRRHCPAAPLRRAHPG
jgi:excinuclease ABC subunit A